MRLYVVLIGVLLSICGIISVVYTGLTYEQPIAIIGWLIGLILIILGSYLAGKELKTKSK